MNDVLDQLERENFFSADVYLLPPENGESDGDSENSDDETSLSRPLADRFTPQILKGEGSAEIVDEDGSHILGCEINEKVAGDENSGPPSTGNVAVASHSAGISRNQMRKRQRCQNLKTSKQQNPLSDVQMEPTDTTTCEINEKVPGTVAVASHSAGISRNQTRKRQRCENLKTSKRQNPLSDVQVEPTDTTTCTELTAASTVMKEGLPRVWKKADLKSEQCDKFCWNYNNTPENMPDLEPSGYFELFWDNALFQKIQHFSKVYASQQDPRSLFDVTVDELKVVVGILLISGYNTVPRRRLYWSCESDVRNDMIANAMSRNRFDEILSKLHCADNALLPPLDRFGKVRPVIDYLNDKYAKYWPVTQHLSIDESMIPYYGHHGCKQHIHGKPIRFGFKIWSLNSSTDGYCCHIEPYQGAGSGMRITQLGLGGSVVVDLISQLPQDRHYHIYADNFFSSLTLVDHLTQSGIGYTGTVRENRTQNCPLMASKDLAKKTRGECDYRQDVANDLVVVKWHDNAVVSIVSNCHGIEPLRSTARWSAKEKKQVTVTVPDVVHQYNRFMGGTDLMDRNISNYRITIRLKKWWWSVFSFLLSSSVVNAWCIHRRAKSVKLDLLSFTRKIAVTYILNCSQRLQIGRPRLLPKLKQSTRRVVPDDVRTSAGHYPVSTSQNRCKVCQKNTKRGCGKCGVNLHDYCFMIFHSS